MNLEKALGCPKQYKPSLLDKKIEEFKNIFQTFFSFEQKDMNNDTRSFTYLVKYLFKWLFFWQYCQESYLEPNQKYKVEHFRNNS